MTCSRPFARGYQLTASLLLLLLGACGLMRPAAPFLQQQQVNDLSITLETNADPQLNLPYRFTVTLSDAAGQPVDSHDVYLDLDMPAMPMGANRPIAEPEAPGRYSATTAYTMTGDWEITVVASVDGVEHRATFFLTVADD
jgi:nitrogen fixation protein FixH